MKPPKVRVSWLMGAVAVVAVNLGVFRGLYAFGGLVGQTAVFNTLPTANLLSLGALAGRRNREFVVGFVTSGIIAMASLLAWHWFDEASFLKTHFAMEDATRDFLGLDYIGWHLYAMYVVGSAVQVLPQVAIALMGGFAFASLRRTPRPEPVASEPG